MIRTHTESEEKDYGEFQPVAINYSCVVMRTVNALIHVHET
jgi:hypothetical protein